jgi:hypothetical protein
MGEWEPEEVELFLDTIKKFGCGDRWGLFSSYITHRVGYQVSSPKTNLITLITSFSVQISIDKSCSLKEELSTQTTKYRAQERQFIVGIAKK